MFDRLSLAGLVPVIKVARAEDAVPLCQALVDGGLNVAEITFRTDAAEEAIRLVHESLPEVLLGAGTVLTTEQADRAMAAGAQFIVSPGFNPDVVGHCTQKGYPVLPGCSSPSDIEKALAMGLKAVKFFPAEALGGLKMLKALSAPYGEMRFVPTGGINEKNLVDYLSFSKILACGGSWMVPSDAVQAQDWATVTALARQAVNLVMGFEIRHIGVNAGGDEEAAAAAKRLALLFGWPAKEGDSNYFIGEGIEIMKRGGRGQHGHIAIACNDLSRARHYLEGLGFRFDDSSLILGTNGKPRLLYLREEILGFALHLLQK